MVQRHRQYQVSPLLSRDFVLLLLIRMPLNSAADDSADYSAAEKCMLLIRMPLNSAAVSVRF